MPTLTFLVAALLLPTGLARAADLANVRDFVDETQFQEIQISPDGTHLAFITRTNDWQHDRPADTLWAVDLGRAGGLPSAPIAIGELTAASSLRWSPDGRLLTFIAMNAKDGIQVFSLAITPAATPQRITRVEDFPRGVDLYEWLPDGSGLIIESDAPSEDELAAAEALRLKQGDVRRLPAPQPHPMLFRITLADHHIEPLGPAPFLLPAGLAISPDGRRLALVGGGLRETSDDTDVALLSLAPPMTPAQTSHDRVFEDRVLWSEENLYATGMGEERNGRYTATENRLYRVGDQGTFQASPFSPAPEGGIDDIIALEHGRFLIASLRSTHMTVSVVDPAAKTSAVVHETRGWIHDLSASSTGRVAFAAGDARHFGDLYVAESPDRMGAARQVTHFNEALAAGPIPTMETVTWTATDGVAVEGVLFWPPGHPERRNLPLIIDLHGGPFGAARTEALGLFGSFMSYPALLAARGYLVLNVNYRGSAGRGDAFVRGIEGHLCSVPADDVVRGVEDLVRRGWADRTRVGAIGYSGGGTLTKCLAGRSQAFAAIVTGAGVWDEIALFGSRRGQSRAETFFDGKPPLDDAERWGRESARGALATVKTPTLIVAGEQDGGAPAQATEMYYDLLWRGVPTELLLFPDESHIFGRPSHRVAKIEAELAWFEKYLRDAPSPH
jgi:dipeptidyl aminopeptidase/acylaminoacyl peptidase